MQLDTMQAERLAAHIRQAITEFNKTEAEPVSMPVVGHALLIVIYVEGQEAIMMGMPPLTLLGVDDTTTTITYTTKPDPSQG